MGVYSGNRNLLERLNRMLYDVDTAKLPERYAGLFADECIFHMCHPFGDIMGADAFFSAAYEPLLKAVPDLERRQYICISGPSTEYGDWVGCAGNYVGVFEQPWLDIPPTLHMVFMRFHEFYRIEEDRIVEVQAIWDIPQVMMQANAWPLSPSLGVEFMVPAPATQDGTPLPERDETVSSASLQLVLDMLDGLQMHAEGGPEAMQLERYWHPKMSWYGPSGIGSNRRISGFRNWHQIPFLKAMPDRDINRDVPLHFFAEGPYVGVTGWPNMKLTISGDGWLGIAPAGQVITLCSLDFWRCEHGLIRENWVLVDLLDMYRQIGIDVFERMREVTVARQLHHPAL